MLEPGNGVTPELGEIDFQYHDADSFQVELAELYSYSEEPEFHSGPEKLRYFVGSDRWGVAVSYESSGSQQARQRVSAVRRLLEAAESANTQLRADAIGALLYLAQGAWDEPDVRKLLPDHRQAQVLNNIRENCILLYQQGAWPLLLQLLRFEAELQPSTTPTTLTLADSRRTREILSVLCTMAEVFRNIGSDATESERALKRSFSDEVSQVSSDGGGLLAVSLLQMVTAFCNGSANQLPLKKLLLLLWKSLLLSLGGIEDLKRIKAEARNMEGLPAAPPDTTDVVRTMRPASPPASLVDMIEVQQQQQQQQQQQRKSSRNQFKRQSFVKQSSMDDQETANGAANEVGGASVVMRLVGNADDQSKQANIDPTELPPDAVDPDEAAAAA